MRYLPRLVPGASGHPGVPPTPSPVPSICCSNVSRMLTGPRPAEVAWNRGRSRMRLLDFPRREAPSSSRTMLLNHGLSYRLWQRACALPSMTFVIVKGARGSVSDR